MCVATWLLDPAGYHMRIEVRAGLMADDDTRQVLGWDHCGEGVCVDVAVSPTADEHSKRRHCIASLGLS